MSVLGAVYRSVARPVLFALDPESAHGVASSAMALAQRVAWMRWALRWAFAPAVDPRLAVTLWGKTLASPVGLAAGFDKRAVMYNALGALGFSFVEVGTVTARAQPGNPRPRLFRLPDDRALINRMGFNNPGAHAMERSIRAHAPDGVMLGVNLGKSKVTELADAARDYAESAALLAPVADYLVVNVSSPNTPGLRSLQSVEALRPIVSAVREAMGDAQRPLLVKIAPDLDDADLDAVVDLARTEHLDGIIATNTTLRRDGLATSPDVVTACGAGGLSGPPVRARALDVVRRIHRRAGPALPIVGVGGITTADDAWAMLRAGATAVQVYTGFIYEGPGMARDLVEGLAARAGRESVTSLASMHGARAEETTRSP